MSGARVAGPSLLRARRVAPYLPSMNPPANKSERPSVSSARPAPKPSRAGDCGPVRPKVRTETQTRQARS